MTFSWSTFLFEILNFVVLAYILHRLLYRPLRTAVEKRQEENNAARQEAEKAREEAAALQQKLAAQTAEVEKQREDVLRQAREQAETERHKLLGEAERTARKRQDEMRQTMKQERDESLRSLRQEVIGMAVDLTRRLLHEAADSTLHRQLVLRLVESLGRLSQGERERLRRQWQPDDSAMLETAENLDPETLARLTETVRAVLDRPVTLVVQAAPALLGGVRLRLGGNVWDATLAGQLDGAHQESPEKEVACPTSPGN